MMFLISSLSEKGKRKINEDSCSYLHFNENACFAVADGLGGHEGGEIASNMAVNAILEAFSNKKEISIGALKSYLDMSQKQLLDYQSKMSQYLDMRTTIVVLITDCKNALWAHIGDSRLYYLSNGRIKKQTKDHSVPQVLANIGEISYEQVRFHEDRNKLLRVLGDGENFKPTIEKYNNSLYSGDAFLICTDGFWEYVTEEQIEKDFNNSSSPEQWLRLMEKRILKLTENVKDSDNYTAMAIYII